MEHLIFYPVKKIIYNDKKETKEHLTEKETDLLEYLIKNNSGHKMIDLISAFNKNTEKKLKVKWLSNKIINEKIYPYKKLKGWTPKESSKIDIIKIIQKK